MHRLGARALATSSICSTFSSSRPPGRAEAVSLAGALDVQRVAIELRIHRDARRSPNSSQRADDAHRDLAAVGDQDLREHAAAEA